MNEIQKVIAVTGASRGIGSAIAEELLDRGHIVGCLSRKGLGSEDRVIKGNFLNFCCDLTIEKQIRGALTSLVEETGRLDGLINNAGLHLEGPSADFPTKDLELIMRTNVIGTFITCREAYPHLIANQGGLIINIGSFYENLGVKLTAAYSASKAAIGSLTRSLAVEWAQENIRVLNIAPGFIATDLNLQHMKNKNFRDFLKRRIPTGGPGNPDDIARLIGALFDEDLPFLTGETIVIDGGQSINQ